MRAFNNSAKQKIEEAFITMQAQRLAWSFHKMHLANAVLAKAPINMLASETNQAEQGWRALAKSVHDNKGQHKTNACFEIGAVSLDVLIALDERQKGATVQGYSSERNNLPNTDMQRIIMGLNRDFSEISKKLFGKSFQGKRMVTEMDVVYGFTTPGETLATKERAKNPEGFFNFYVSFGAPGYINSEKQMRRGTIYLCNTRVISPFDISADGMVTSTQVVAHQELRNWPKLSSGPELIVRGVARRNSGWWRRDRRIKGWERG